MPNQAMAQPTEPTVSAAAPETYIPVPCNGIFRILSTEDPAGFEALKQSLFVEHQPATPTESILVNGMAESHWLAQRALRLQDTCVNPDTGAITNEKTFSLYLRYHTSLTRSFHKSLNDLFKLRSDKRKAERGFEAQNIQKEKHEMKKKLQEVELFKKDVAAHLELSKYVREMIDAKRTAPGFEAQFAAELEKRGMTPGQREEALLATA